MKQLITILFTLCLTYAYSQNYKSIDEKVKNYPNYDQIDQLVLRVNNSFDTDTEKVRAYYTWIAHNVTYDLIKYYSIRPPVLGSSFNSASINKSIENQKRKKIAKQVFKERKALCLGYSSLFTELCLKSNIEVEIIKGITKVSVNDIENPRFTKNHSWNAVKINNQWKLLDLTFASGYLNGNASQWVKHINDFYFFIDPEILLSSHLPEQSKFQFVPEPISTEAFFKRPIFYKKYFESGLKMDNYQKGLLSVSKENKKIRINFKDQKDHKDIYYKFNNEIKYKKLSLKQNTVDHYEAILKYRSDKSKVLSFFYDNHKILDFKIEQ